MHQAFKLNVWKNNSILERINFCLINNNSRMFTQNTHTREISAMNTLPELWIPSWYANLIKIPFPVNAFKHMTKP